MNDDIKSLNKRLEKKMQQIEKFENIVRDAISVQKKMRETLKVKHQEVQDLKVCWLFAYIASLRLTYSIDWIG